MSSEEDQATTTIHIQQNFHNSLIKILLSMGYWAGYFCKEWS